MKKLAYTLGFAGLIFIISIIIVLFVNKQTGYKNLSMDAPQESFVKNGIGK